MWIWKNNLDYIIAAASEQGEEANTLEMGMPAKETNLLQDQIRSLVLRVPVLQQSSIAIQLLWFPLLTSQPIPTHHCKSFLPGGPHPNPLLLHRHLSSLAFALGSNQNILDRISL